MTRVFLDANVYFAGIYSEGGASFLILELVKKQKLKAFASRLVLHEAVRNLCQKATSKVVAKFHRYLADTKIVVLPADSLEGHKELEDLIHPKDLPVLVSAMNAKVDFLITLYRGSVLES